MFPCGFECQSSKKMKISVNTKPHLLQHDFCKEKKNLIFQIEQFLADSYELMIKEVWEYAETSARMRRLVLVSLFSAKMQSVPVTAKCDYQNHFRRWNKVMESWIIIDFFIFLYSSLSITFLCASRASNLFSASNHISIWGVFCSG